MRTSINWLRWSGGELQDTIYQTSLLLFFFSKCLYGLSGVLEVERRYILHLRMVLCGMLAFFSSHPPPALTFSLFSGREGMMETKECVTLLEIVANYTPSEMAQSRQMLSNSSHIYEN